MAGNTLYLGNLFSSLNGKIDQQITKVDQQIAKLDQQITALNSINTSIGMNTPAGNLKAGTTNSIIVQNPVTDITFYDGNINTTYMEVGRCKCFCNGKVRLSATIKSTGNAVISYSLDGGTTKITLGSNSTNTYQTYTADINVTNLQEIVFHLSKNGSSIYSYLQANSLKVLYDVVNLSVDGFVVKS